MHGTVVRGIDFKNADKALVDINTWIANATEQRIPRLLGPGSFSRDTAFCITSMTFFKAPWQLFKARETQAQPFLVDGLDPTPVPTMISNHSFGSEVHETFTALTLPIGHSFQLLLLVPKNPTGLRTLIETVDVELLQQCTQLKRTEIKLHLPRFKIAPSTLQLREFLRARGVQSAFDNTGKADFSALSAGRVFLDQVHDAAQFEIDENGVSGAGASVIVAMALGGDGDPLPPKTVFRVNRPFLFALQHQDTSACIFLGCVSDPRAPEPKEH